VHGHQVDAFFAEHNLIVECDGWEFHKQRSAFEDDRERDAEHLRYGLNTVRITRERLGETPDREAQRLQEILNRTSR
jgi:very-short-patch-repair endonuclease